MSVRCVALGLSCLLLNACGGKDETAPSGSNITVEPAPVPLPGWELVWNDEFSRSGLPDASKWRYDTHRNRLGWYNNELQYYSSARLENSRVENGKLIITARKERLTSAADYGGQNYTSARLFTQGVASWTYGRFEIRAKLPCALGTWPAIWTLGTGGAWPDDGEIDIMEQKGTSAAEKQKVLGTVHTRSGFAGAGPSANQTLLNACTDFNTYHMEWNATSIVIGVNGSNYFTYLNQNIGNSQWPFNKPQYLLLNVAVGGFLGGTVNDAQLPASMEVDWVRVYRKL